MGEKHRLCQQHRGALLLQSFLQWTIIWMARRCKCTDLGRRVDSRAQFMAHVTAQCLGRHDLTEFGPSTVTGVPIHNRDLPVCGSTVIGVQVVQHTHTDVEGCDSQGTHPADVLQPGHRDCPIEIVDSDETTLADSDRTATDSDLTESDDDDITPRDRLRRRSTFWTHGTFRHAQLDAGTEWDAQRAAPQNAIAGYV